MSTTQTEAADVMAARDIARAYDFARAAIEPPELLDEAPEGVTVLLSTVDEQATIAAGIGQGLAEPRQGRAVTFWVDPGEIQALIRA